MEELEQRRLLSAGASIIVTGTDVGAPPNVKVFDAATGDLKLSFFAYDPSYLGGVRVASADVTGDGTPDIITAPGPNAPPNVRVFDGKTGDQVAGPLGSFFAYDPGYLGGVEVGAGDVNGDGHADIITGVDAHVGVGPNVKVFSGADGSTMRSFWAYDPGFYGGVRVAAGDVNSDGFADIITAPAIATSNVKVFDGQTNNTIASFFAYEPTYNGGLYVASGDVDADGHDDVIVSRGTGTPQVTTFSGATYEQIHQYNAYDPAFQGGARVGAVDANGDGHADVITGPGPGGGPHVKLCNCNVEEELENFYAYDPSYLGGIYVAGGEAVT
jgi:hypothetical protein